MFSRVTCAALALVMGAVTIMATESKAAAITGLQVEGGGTQQVFQLNNGNFLGLWGIDNREGANPGAGIVNINSAADLIGGFTSGGGSIVNFYNGSNPINGGASEFDELIFGFSVADDARLFDAIWIEWTGGDLVYKRPSGGTSTMTSSNITRQGDPIAPIPLPAGIYLMLAALASLGFLRFRKKQLAPA